MSISTDYQLPLISVIVPIYNVDKYLQKCIDSIIRQTYHNLEIILVDDGSSDSCPGICDEYAQKDNRIQVIHKQNQGVGFARNTGLDISTGDFLMFVDPDDYLPNDAIDYLFTRIKADESDMVIGQFVKVFDDGTEKPSSYNWMTDKIITRNEAFELLASDSYPLPCYVWTKLYRKSVFCNLRFCSYKTSEDVEILPKIIYACRLISLSSRVVYYYYQRSTSIVHNKTDATRMDDLSACLDASKFLLACGAVEAAKYYYRSAVISIANMKRPKAGRKKLKLLFPKSELVQFNNKGLLFYIAWIGMYVPHFYQIILTAYQMCKTAISKIIH